MQSPFDTLLEWLDRRAETGSRAVAQRTGRRSFLSRAGAAMLGGSLLPMLPFDRGFGEAMARDATTSDAEDGQCDYWRYCAMDGNLCSECGGSLTECPPGSDVSQVSWIGTCRNPTDHKDYLVSYNDCCGKASCSGSFCFNSENERPGYRMGVNNDINWCMANASKGYHCTVAVLVGVAESV